MINVLNPFPILNELNGELLECRRLDVKQSIQHPKQALILGSKALIILYVSNLSPPTQNNNQNPN